ncbi:MAG: HEPN domain-containing protein, partial [Acetivibrio sp.]
MKYTLNTGWKYIHFISILRMRGYLCMQHDNQSDIGTIEDLAYYRLKVAKEDLETAEDNLRDNHLRAANNRAYYSIYHTITSILA